MATDAEKRRRPSHFIADTSNYEKSSIGKILKCTGGSIATHSGVQSLQFGLVTIDLHLAFEMFEELWPPRELGVSYETVRNWCVVKIWATNT